MLSHLALVTMGVTALQVLTGAAAGVAFGIVIGDVPGQLTRLTGAALVFVPAILVVTAVAAFLFGALPDWSAGLSWGALALCLILGLLGPLFRVPDVLRNLSPFTHVPAVPAAEVALAPLAWLAVIAVGTAVIGTALFRRRDLTTP